jgi:uncharacterized repeat protein (TIGR03806 family)
VPSGSGMITLAYDQIDIFDNKFLDNDTAGIIHTSYEIFPEGAGRPAEHRIDWYTEGLHIWHNQFSNNGNHLPLPTTTNLIAQDVAKFLPAIVGLKNQAACLNPLNLTQCLSAGVVGFRGAHIIWDGLLDTYTKDCPYPLDANGDPVPADARGKPILNNEVPDPSCHYNAYKFDTAAAGAPRKVPDWTSSCIDDDNDFSSDSLAFSNFHGTKGLELIVESKFDPTTLAQFPADLDITPHRCKAQYGRNLDPLPAVVIPPFVRSGDYDPAPSAEQVAQLCNAKIGSGEVNFDASKVNCPTLDQYHLFDDDQDPTSTPRGGGMPYVLNTKLFTDYAVKYRVAYLPPGTTAVYRDSSGNGTNAALTFPAGTIIAKTFAFADETAGTEVPMETRLLIKRVSSKGVARWDGLPYVWSTDASTGKRIAELTLGGTTTSAHWDHTDVDSGIRHTGSTSTYLVPHANQCLSCHSNEDNEPGAAPIGPKVRFMNRPYVSESKRVTGQSRHDVAGKNQLAYWCSHGLIAGCPADLGVDEMRQVAAKLERIPTFNKPGDSGFAANSPQDIEARARAYLEVNCAHCHNVRGFAASTGLYLDSLRKVDVTYGICKNPTATGQEGKGGRTYDIHPANVADSVLAFRIGPEATTPAARMPPIARSVVDDEGRALIEQWIGTVITADESKYPGSTSCGG